MSLLTDATLLFTSLRSAMKRDTAVTEVVLTNSTMSTIEIAIRVQSLVTVSSGEHYRLLRSELAPLQTRPILQINRLNCVSGEIYDYYIDITAQTGDATITLHQRVLAGQNRSQVTFGASGTDFKANLTHGNKIRTYDTNFCGPCEFGLNSEFNNCQLNYVIQQNAAKPDLSSPETLDVLAYNVWLTPIAGSRGIPERSTYLPEALAGYDVVAGSEFFNRRHSNQILHELKDEYPFQTERIIKESRAMPAGVHVLSRWPILKQDHHIFTVSANVERFASKAVVYALIDKEGHYYHVFATHLQAFDNPANRGARRAQLHEMAHFVESMDIPADEPVIYAGDFNINKLLLPDDRDLMEEILCATEPKNLGYRYSYDSTTNTWAKDPFIEFLDYTLYSCAHKEPLMATQEVIAPRSIAESMWKTWDLSDHYAVHGHFTFGE